MERDGSWSEESFETADIDGTAERQDGVNERVDICVWSCACMDVCMYVWMYVGVRMFRKSERSIHVGKGNGNLFMYGHRVGLVGLDG